MGSINRKGKTFLLLLTVCLSALPERVAHAYVLPTEQILQLMAANPAKTRTLIVHQHVEEITPDRGAWGFDEIVTMKSPDLIHSSIKESGETAGRRKDGFYLQFFLANSASRLMALLLEAGIDVQKVGYTRTEGVVAYRIGENQQSGPMLLVEKARFLPLLLSYKAPDPGGTLARVRFLDYRRVEQAWYPFEIFQSTAAGYTEKCTVRFLKVNGAVSASLFGRR